MKQIEQLHGFLMNDMGRAVAFLAEAVKILQSYAEVSIGTRAVPAPTTSEADSLAGTGESSDPGTTIVPKPDQ